MHDPLRVTGPEDKHVISKADGSLVITYAICRCENASGHVLGAVKGVKEQSKLNLTDVLLEAVDEVVVSNCTLMCYNNLQWRDYQSFRRRFMRLWDRAIVMAK
jgi:hypothetical protein